MTRRNTALLLCFAVAQGLRTYPWGPGSNMKARKQELDNYMDVQYSANISVGGQLISGIVDTGSFELVVFSAQCHDCGMAGVYRGSEDYSRGPLKRGLYYGSGDVYAREAFDQVEIGPFPPVNQSFWEAYDADMPVLRQAHFESIIGVGPPEMPSAEAWKQTEDSVRNVMDALESNGEPTRWQADAVDADLNFSVEISQEPVMLTNYGVKIFSLCLLKVPGSPGYLIWNDTSVYDHPTYFSRVQIVGRHTWSVNMRDVRLMPRWIDAAPADLGCRKGCGAIVDSGTSLLMMPSGAVKSLEAALDTLDAANCDNLQDLPELVFTLDDQVFSLPPDAYITELNAEVPSNMASFARIRQFDRGSCKISVLESFSRSDLGDVWILGMPFFRKYYTSFEVGRNQEERALHIATATSECEPEEPESSSLSRQRSREVFRRQVDMKKMYLPPVVRKAAKGGFMAL